MCSVRVALLDADGDEIGPAATSSLSEDETKIVCEARVSKIKKELADLGVEV